ncbi:MAG: methyltransferase family protein [Mangrovicoccus sp.]
MLGLPPMPAWRYVDIPPTWLATFLLAVWGIDRVSPNTLPTNPAIPVLGAIIALIGLGLISAAVIEMRRYRTTIIPHQMPHNLVQTGVFRLSRNPIYLGDACLLLAAILLFQAYLALFLLPIFILIIDRRFVYTEEFRIQREFGEKYEAYKRLTRRWL